MRTRIIGLIVSGLIAGLAPPANSAALQVAPVSIDVPAPGASASLVLRNLGDKPMNAQIRVFRWLQQNGTDKLVETRDVVASPPFATLKPKAGYTVRVVRVTKKPLVGEETYRLLIDELPDKQNPQGVAVRLVVRYSVPVFFGANRASPPKLTWRVSKKGKRTVVAVTNRGQRHVRISSLKLKTPAGRTLSFGDGLVGYVLGNSTARWSRSGLMKGLKPGSEIIIKAQGDNGPLQAKTRVETIK